MKDCDILFTKHNLPNADERGWGYLLHKPSLGRGKPIFILV